MKLLYIISYTFSFLIAFRNYSKYHFSPPFEFPTSCINIHGFQKSSRKFNVSCCLLSVSFKLPAFFSPLPIIYYICNQVVAKIKIKSWLSSNITFMLYDKLGLWHPCFPVFLPVPSPSKSITSLLLPNNSSLFPWYTFI